MAENQQEIEWQFDVTDLGAIESWLRERAVAGDWQFHFREPETQVDSYFDTADWRFFRAGYALRLRSLADGRSEAALKSFGTEHEGLRRRHEIGEPLNSRAGARDQTQAVLRAPGPVGQRVRAVLGKKPLRALHRLFDVRTHRRYIELHQDGMRVAEIALDDIVITADRRQTPVHCHRVEVELKHAQDSTATPAPPDAADSPVHRFVAEMRAACDMQPAHTSKFELGLRACDHQLQFMPDLGRPANSAELSRDPTIGKLAYAVLREHFAQFLSYEPGVRLGEDAEAVHRMRVATRRLRAVISLFRDFLPPTARRLRDELRWIARLLGSVRDLDVQLERLDSWPAGDKALAPQAVHALKGVLSHQREQAHDKLLRGLNSARYERLVAGFTDWLRQGPSAEGASENGAAHAAANAASPARKEMPRLILRRYVAMREHGDAIEADSPPEEYHELRIQCKRLRYALEFATPLYPKATRELLERLIALQDLLGMHQDAYVAIEEMRHLSLSRQHELPAETIFALGELSQRYAHRAEELRAEFPKLYRRVKGKAWQRMQRALDDE